MTAGTTWNASDKSANITLSGGNLTATSSGAGAVRATNYISGTDKVFFAVTYDGAQTAIGVGDSTASLSTQPGSDTTHSIAYRPQTASGDVYYNGSIVTSIGQATAGDIIYCCVDFANNKIYFARNNGSYNNSSTANPATNTGGITISVTGNLYPLWYAAATGAVTTANFGAVGFYRAAPSGFTTVADIAVTTVTTATTGNVTVASDAASATAVMEAWGGGGGTFSGTAQAASGEGGGYAKTNAVSCAASSVIYYSVGAGGLANNASQSNGTDSWVRKGTNSAPTVTTDGVLAKGGVGASARGAAGTARTTSGQVGNVVFSGGAGVNAQGGGGSRGGSAGGGSAGTAANGPIGVAGSGSAGGTASAAVTGGGKGGNGGAGGGNAGAAGTPGGGGGGGGSSSGVGTAGGVGKITFTLSTYYAVTVIANPKRYWVGGTGNVNDTAHWSDASGGASGATLPNSSYDVVFDAASDNAGAFTITVNASFECASFDNTAVDQVMTLAGSSAINSYGSLTLKSTTVRTYTGTITFAAISTGKTITTNGVSFGNSPVVFNGVGGGWTLGSAWTSFNITHTAGALDTGGYNVTTSNPFNTTGSTTRSLTLGASVLTVDTWNATSTGMTFNAGTSLIKNTSNNAFSGGGLTYYDVQLPTGNSVTSGISGANTFHNLIFSGTDSASAVNPTWVRIYANQTVTGTFTPSQTTNVNARVMVVSDTPGTQRTITAAAVSLINVDFQSIVGAGAATWSGTSVGDGGDNSGITFTAAKTVYAVGTTNWSWTANSWATLSGGGPSFANFPLPQDTVIIDNSSVNTSATITATSNYLYPTIDCSARSNAMSLNLTGLGITRPLTVNSAITLTGLIFSLAANQNFNQNSATISGAITVNNPGTTLTLTGNFTTSSTFTHNYGALALGSYTLTATTFTAAQTTTRTLDFGTGKISLTANNATIVNIDATNLTVSGTPVIECSYSGATGTRTITTGTATEAQAISFSITAGTDTVSSGAVNKNLILTGFAGTLSNITRTVYGNLTIPSGATLTAGSNTTTFGATSGTQTITTNGVTLDFPLTFNGVGGTFTLNGALTQGSSRAATLTNGTLNLAGYTYTAGSFATAAGTKNITFNAGTLTIIGSGATAFNNAAPTNFTTTAGTGTGYISMTSASAKTFVGGGSTYNCTLSQGGAGALTITGSNTFNDIRNTTQPVTVSFTAGTTTTFANGFSLSGTAGNLVTIGSVTAAQHTLSKASGTVDVSYCSISYSNATGGAAWLAYV